jgi:hypothetical protein
MGMTGLAVILNRDRSQATDRTTRACKHSTVRPGPWLGMEESYDHTNFLVHSNVSSLVQVRAFGRRVPQASATIF